MSRLALRLTPQGHLRIEDQDDAPEISDAACIRLKDAFGRGSGPGLVQLGAGEVGEMAPPTFVWWRDFAARYVEALCVHSSGAAADAGSSLIPPVPPTTQESWPRWF